MCWAGWAQAGVGLRAQALPPSVALHLLHLKRWCLCEPPPPPRCSLVLHHHLSRRHVASEGRLEPACPPALTPFAPGQLGGPGWGPAEAARTRCRGWREGSLATDTWTRGPRSRGWGTLAHLFREGGQLEEGAS